MLYSFEKFLPGTNGSSKTAFSLPALSFLSLVFCFIALLPLAAVPQVADAGSVPDISITMVNSRNGVWYQAGNCNCSFYGRKWAANALAVPADYDGDGKDDIAVKNSAGRWLIFLENRRSALILDSAALNQRQAVAAPADFDGDKRADIVEWDKVSGQWFIRLSSKNYKPLGQPPIYGSFGDIPMPGDYDGDKLADLSFYRPSTGEWFIRQSSDNKEKIVDLKPGQSGENVFAIQGDFDGDHIQDPAIYESGKWLIFESSSQTVYPLFFGNENDVPAAFDYDGDGVTDPAVYSAGNISISFSNGKGFAAYPVGSAGDYPLPYFKARRAK
jgi:hypothetical protein